MLMLKCQVIKLHLLFKRESHSSSAGVFFSFLKILNIIWFTMRKKEGKKTTKESESIYNFI
jgi:hypothetical protein